MTRIPRLTPESLDGAQRELFGRIANGPRAGHSAFRLTGDDGALEGPFNAMLLHPPVGDPLQALGAAIRYRGNLTGRAREIAVLLVAVHQDSEFERYAHQRVGLQCGLTRAEIAVLGQGKHPALDDPRERAVATVTTRILTERTLTDQEYAKAERILGASVLFELTTLIGYYELLALQLRIFDVR